MSMNFNRHKTGEPPYNPILIPPLYPNRDVDLPCNVDIPLPKGSLGPDDFPFCDKLFPRFNDESLDDYEFRKRCNSIKWDKLRTIIKSLYECNAVNSNIEEICVRPTSVAEFRQGILDAFGICEFEHDEAAIDEYPELSKYFKDDNSSNYYKDLIWWSKFGDGVPIDRDIAGDMLSKLILDNTEIPAPSAEELRVSQEFDSACDREATKLFDYNVFEHPEPQLITPEDSGDDTGTHDTSESSNFVISELRQTIHSSHLIKRWQLLGEILDSSNRPNNYVQVNLIEGDGVNVPSEYIPELVNRNDSAFVEPNAGVSMLEFQYLDDSARVVINDGVGADFAIPDINHRLTTLHFANTDSYDPTSDEYLLRCDLLNATSDDTAATSAPAGTDIDPIDPNCDLFNSLKLDGDEVSNIFTPKYITANGLLDIDESHSLVIRDRGVIDSHSLLDRPGNCDEEESDGNVDRSSESIYYAIFKTTTQVPCKRQQAIGITFPIINGTWDSAASTNATGAAHLMSDVKLCDNFDVMGVGGKTKVQGIGKLNCLPNGLDESLLIESLDNDTLFSVGNITRKGCEKQRLLLYKRLLLYVRLCLWLCIYVSSCICVLVHLYVCTLLHLRTLLHLNNHLTIHSMCANSLE